MPLGSLAHLRLLHVGLCFLRFGFDSLQLRILFFDHHGHL